MDSPNFPASHVLQSSPVPIALAAGLVLLIFYRVFSASRDNVHDLGGFSLRTAWPFFTQRYDFIWSNFKRTGQKIFRFRVLQHRVVALSGDVPRKTFFENSSLDLAEGYRILLGGSPRMQDINVEAISTQDVSVFIKLLLQLLRKDRINQLLPTLFDDVQRRVADWGEEGKINPFREVYELVFQMTVRLATCRELSEDKEAIEQLAHHYWQLEQNATPVALLLPWFPGRARKAKKEATQNLYNLIVKYVDLRREASLPTTDAIDILIAAGHSTDIIVGFVLGVIFAGVINTGMNVCWNLLYLGSNPEWKKKVSGEVQALIANHTDTLSNEPLHKRLASIPMEAWENEMPALDSCIRETLRLISTTTFLRRNLVKDLDIDGAKIGRGDFLAYSAADVHHNEDIYPNHKTFDPSRFDKDRAEDKKVTFGFVGWGVGRHPCVGMRVAKLEMKLVLALILAGYEFEIIDAAGKFPSALPQPDKNDLQQARPIGEPCFMKFRRTVK